MAFTFSLNQAPASYADCMYKLKEFLKTIGWTIVKSGTGTSGTYNSSGDSLSSAGAIGSYAWFVAQDPYGAQLSVQTNNISVGASYRIKHSYAAGFTGGSPDADTVSSATDEIVVRGSGTDASPNVGQVWCSSAVPAAIHFIGDAGSGSFCAFGSTSSGTGLYLPTAILLYERIALGSWDPGDPSPYVMYFSAGNTDQWLTSALSALNIQGRFSQGTVIQHGMSRQGENSLRIPGSVAGPWDGREHSWPIAYTREGSGQSFPNFKGKSRLFKWTSRSNILYGTYGSLDSAKDHLVVGNVFVPWDGSTAPTATAAENLLSPVIDSVRGYSLVQATAANQGAVVAGPVAGVSARRFDGTNDGFEGGTVNSIDLAMAQGQWTIECFFKPISFTTYGTIFTISGGVTDASAASNYAMFLGVTNTNKLRVFWEHATGTNDEFISTMPNLSTAGVWYHLAAVKNASNVRFYVDGVFQDQAAWTNNTTSATAAWMSIGCDGGAASGTFLNGDLRDVRISNKARSDAEMTAMAALKTTTGTLPIDEYTYALFRLGGVETLTMDRITDPLQKSYRMRGYDNALGRYVYWISHEPDTDASEYPGAATPSDIVVSKILRAA